MLYFFRKKNDQPSVSWSSLFTGIYRSLKEFWVVTAKITCFTCHTNHTLTNCLYKVFKLSVSSINQLKNRSMLLRTASLCSLTLFLPAVEEPDELFAGAYTKNVSVLHFVSYCIIH